MFNTIPVVPEPVNEPIYGYGPGSSEKKLIKEHLKRLASTEIEVPIIIGGKEVRSGDMAENVMPHDHRHVLCKYHK